jgi:hypothetical protein
MQREQPVAISLAAGQVHIVRGMPGQFHRQNDTVHAPQPGLLFEHLRIATHGDRRRREWVRESAYPALPAFGERVTNRASPAITA